MSVVLLDISLLAQTVWEIIQKDDQEYSDIKVVILNVSSEENFVKRF